ncbi:MAG: AMP-binding protein [Gammaproteobacteria bacterium]|nr:AMP-binding protein [Gammaproteobacteria bacterium]MBU1554759.1 AMP-binding protein [Gammaproteobacteria bacterium]MBU2071825.1 AMP-binding protein [Gammaproteobacteria bacterium]MBU2181906.1 AMP-binding protein [Gammaproteobacteria bacterium]MBU2205459.1 AMP-binding protein [Gammaproteobacteria bacterium]
MQISLPQSARLTDVGSDISLSAAEIEAKIAQWQMLLQGYGATRVVITADSSISWVLADLACLSAGLVLTALPTYLSDAQRQSVINSLEPDIWLSDTPVLDPACSLLDEFAGLLLYQRQVQSAVVVPAGTQIITFTSGSTGAPKGVCLSLHAQLDVALGLKARVERLCEGPPRHLCMLPLPTLLENIAGVYAPLLAGGEVFIAPDTLRGFAGSRLVKPQALLQLISTIQPKSLILVPELLKLLLQAAEQGWVAPQSLQFIAVGGAYVSPALLQRAAGAHLPVYQGYGLSECASVVALSDTPAKMATDTVGLPLSCRSVEIIDGELVVNTPFLGYLGQDGSASDKVYTGDLAEFTSQGELRILGRRKNLLINSFGRNISPEWVESALTDSGLISQAMLLGDAEPYCAALVFAHPAVSDAAVAASIASVNDNLPDYARIVRYQRLEHAFSTTDGTLTDNGRLRRESINQKYAADIITLFANQLSADVPVTGEQYELLSHTA